MPVRYFLQSEGTNNAVFSAGPTPNPVYGSRELNLQEAQQFLQSNPNVPFNPLRTGPSDPFNISREDIIAGNIGDTNRFGSYTDPLTGEQLSNVSISQIQGAQNRYTGVQSGTLKDLGQGRTVPVGSPRDIGVETSRTGGTGEPLNAEDILRARGEGTPNEIPVNQLLPGGLPQFDEQGRPIQPTQQDFEKFRDGFNAAKEAGVTSPDTVGGAADVIGKYTPSTPSVQGPDQISTFLQTDPFLNNIMSQWNDYMSEQNQRTSLTETYSQMLKESGIEAIDTELISLKNIIEGTRDDIALEVEKAGGFATESQIEALTNARNKQMIRNYNTLVETRNAKASYLNTMIGLESQDRAEADRRFDAMMNFGFQIANYQQQMRQNALDQFDRLVDTIGYNGILNSLSPQEVQTYERFYGLPSGALEIAASRETEALDFERKQIQSNLQLDELQAENLRKQIAGRDTFREEVDGRVKLFDSQTGELIADLGIADTGFDATIPSEFSSVVESAAGLLGAERGKAARRAVGQALVNQDYVSAYAQIANSVEESLNGENKNRFSAARTDYNVMQGMRDAIQEYAEAGGDMGFLKGKVDDISKRFGQLKTDPKFAALATQLEREFQTYRNTMTGAAFGPKESAEYAKVNPRSGASLELNLATIDGAMAQLENRVTSTIETRVPGANRIYQIIAPEQETFEPTLQNLGVSQEDQNVFNSVVDSSNTKEGGGIGGFFSDIWSGITGTFK